MKRTGQHYLLSAEARTISIGEIYKNGEEAAYEMFKKLRWPDTDGEPHCPRCGCLKIYNIKTRKCFKCSACSKQFSVTSDTLLDSRKMSFCDLMAAACIVANSVTGGSAVHLSRDLNINYKTAFVLLHKFRVAMRSENKGVVLKGEVEIDGAVATGFIRKLNHRKKYKKDGRVGSNIPKHRRWLVGMRERGGRAITFAVKRESEGAEIAMSRIHRDSAVYVDEATHWQRLQHQFKDFETINHQVAYSYLDGTHTNNVESLWSRFRCMSRGQHRRLSFKHLQQYGDHLTWLENRRRRSNGENTYALLRLALAHPISSDFKAYWQRRHSLESSTLH